MFLFTEKSVEEQRKREREINVRFKLRLTEFLKRPRFLQKQEKRRGNVSIIQQETNCLRFDTNASMRRVGEE